MAGAGLIAIKRRIKSITNTKKITKAMGLIATAKLRKSRQKVELNKNYYDSFNSIANQVALEAVGNNIYIKGNKSNKKLYIAITSDSGLCGGFNGAIVNKTVEEMTKDRDNSVLMVVGQKGRMNFKRLKYDAVAEYVDISDEPTLKEAKDIARHAMKLYNDGEVGEVYAVYTEFVSTVKQQAVVKKLLPLEVKRDKKVNSLSYFEPEIDTLLNVVVELNLNQELYNFLINSKVSELTARMTAMDGATKNADDLLEDLSLQYNRIRQSAITQEISEIVGGAQAQE